MCGIVGIYSPSGLLDADKNAIRPMASILNYRGPDDIGFYQNEVVALGQSRLSIIDVDGGKQPISNEDDSIWIVFNGEIFNYIELMKLLKTKGHIFKTRSDTEVLIHLYEEFGLEMFSYCNGQFAFAIWDSNTKSLLFGRDRMGICPLFYTILPDKKFVFASEIKSLFCHESIIPEISSIGLDQIFTFWSNIPPYTVYNSIYELPPASFMKIDNQGNHLIKKYWSISFPADGQLEKNSFEYYSENLKSLLNDSINIRLRSDVPVAAYLSGGIDSSIVSAIAKQFNKNLTTFSLTFKDQHFDERTYQNEMVRHLRTEHKTIEVDYNDIANALSEVVWHTEKPILRTAPIPLFLLSGLVKSNGIKVVLTGEGADELLGGYDIFKETKIRRFWSRNPASKFRPLLFSKIYPDIKRSNSANQIWQQFFKYKLEDIDNPYYSHLIRWNNTSQIKSFFNNKYKDQFNTENLFLQLSNYFDPTMGSWNPLSKAQYIEEQLFLSGYLLSSQGDRMMMGNSVEGRFPFLDNNVIDFAATIPPHYKIMGLNEKFILKKTFSDLVPATIIKRTKQPYRAPISKCFSSSTNNARLFTPELVRDYNYFDPDLVAKLYSKLTLDKTVLSERENMAVIGIASTHLIHEQFIKRKWKTSMKS